jgi:arylsulfatase A-like enzyme
MSIDVMPTLLSLARLDAPRDRPLDGVDLSPVLLKQESLPERQLFWASLSNSGRRSEAMRRGHWKLVVTHPKAPPGTFENERIELYRLDQDPGEQNDLADQHADRAAAMLKQLKAWFADTQSTATPQPGGWLANEARPNPGTQ